MPIQYNHSQSSGFFGLGLAPRLLQAIERLGFRKPTPIQLKSIPPSLAGHDIVGIAQTGTGKTLAYGAPLLQRLAQVKGKGLVLVPTRELALQVDEDLHGMGRALGLRSAVLIGGQSLRTQHQALRRSPHVIVATPGRLLDHMGQKSVRLDDTRILVLDEADRMLDMGFAPQIKKILQAVPRERQTMLFSATMPPEIMSLARAYMKLPVQVEIAPSGTAAEDVSQELFVVRKDEKAALLGKIFAEYHGSVLVFSRTKHGAHRIARDIRAMGITAAEIHADRTLAQRRGALEGFKKGVHRVLVATDIASRGIDVKGIELVVNYDLPDDAGDYVHRIGRTGRAGLPGHAISFATPDQGALVRDIERLIRTRLPTTSHARVPAALSSLPPHHARPRRSFRSPSRPRDSVTRRLPDEQGYWMQPRGRRLPARSFRSFSRRRRG